MVLAAQEFIDELRDVGFKGYHHQHPFMRLLHEGQLTREQLQGWAVQRYYYQRRMSVKNAAILANCPVPEVRRIWAGKVIHQVEEGEQGYREMWVKFCEAMGLDREEVEEADILPGVRFAVDAYIDFCLRSSWIEGVATTLSYLFFSRVAEDRVEAFERFYPWIKPEGLERWRLAQKIVGSAGEEIAEILTKYCSTEELQRKASAAVRFKNGVLWSLLDAIHMAYVKS